MVNVGAAISGIQYEFAANTKNSSVGRLIAAPTIHDRYNSCKRLFPIVRKQPDQQAEVDEHQHRYAGGEFDMLCFVAEDVHTQ